jgi:hypothetical protein
VSEHLRVEYPFLDQLVGLVWEVIDQGSLASVGPRGEPADVLAP